MYTPPGNMLTQDTNPIFVFLVPDGNLYNLPCLQDLPNLPHGYVEFRHFFLDMITESDAPEIQDTGPDPLLSLQTAQ